MPFFNLFLTLVMIGISALASSQENPEHWCRNGLFTQMATDFRLAQVKTLSARAYFFSDNESCPANDCQLTSYLIPGDTVILSDHFFDNFVCAWYEPETGGATVGWLRQDDLEVITFAHEPSLEQWQGVWEDSQNTLVINQSYFAEGLIVEGQAFWMGTHDNVHIGGAFGRAYPEGNKLMLYDNEYGCTLELWLLENYLLAHDDKQCGGMNVTFDGMYQTLKGR